MIPEGTVKIAPTHLDREVRTIEVDHSEYTTDSEDCFSQDLLKEDLGLFQDEEVWIHHFEIAQRYDRPSGDRRFYSEALRRSLTKDIYHYDLFSRKAFQGYRRVLTAPLTSVINGVHLHKNEDIYLRIHEIDPTTDISGVVGMREYSLIAYYSKEPIPIAPIKRQNPIWRFDENDTNSSGSYETHIHTFQLHNEYELINMLAEADGCNFTELRLGTDRYRVIKSTGDELDYFQNGGIITDLTDEVAIVFDDIPSGHDSDTELYLRLKEI